MANRNRAKSPSQPAATLITDRFKEKYQLEERIDAGVGGVVYRAKPVERQLGAVAIKFYLPTAPTLFHETSLRSLITPYDDNLFDAEFEFLKQSRHPNIQELISHGTLESGAEFLREYSQQPLKPGYKIRFIVSRFIEGRSLAHWIGDQVKHIRDPIGAVGVTRSLDPHRVRDHLIQILVDVAAALAYIHDDKQYQHFDIRAQNILIEESSRRPIVIDFGYAHCFDLDRLHGDRAHTQISIFADNWPDGLKKTITGLIRETGSNNVERAALRSLVFPGLDLYHFGQMILDVLSYEGIDLVLSRFDAEFLSLVARRVTAWPHALSMRAVDVRDQLAKLVPGYWTLSAELRAGPAAKSARRVSLPTNSLWLSEMPQRLLETHSFRRLQSLNQLSLLKLVFPGATQSRFEHSLAVYVTASELVQALLRSPRFCLLFDSQSISHLLLCALLHDINHFPFLHYFQEVAAESFQKVDVLEIMCDGAATNDSPSVYQLLGDIGISQESFRQVLFEDAKWPDDGRWQFIRSVLNSGADVDKLTYTLDDSIGTGVSFGKGVDKAALLAGADVVLLKSGKDQRRYHLCFRPESLSAVESLIMARYWNFKEIYWHHANRAISAMIAHVVYRLYVEKDDSISEYIRQTLGMSELGAARYLDSRFQVVFKKPSILAGLAQGRRVLYKRLYSLKQPEGVASTDLFNKLVSLPVAKRQPFLNSLGRQLERVFEKALRGMSIGEDDLLLDVPGRALDEDIGEIVVCELKDDGTEERRITSPFMDRLQQGFRELSKTVRLFLSPSLRERIGRENIESRRQEVEDALREAIEVSVPGLKGQIR